MKLEGRLPFRVALLRLTLMTILDMAVTQSDGLTQSYCSNDNTGSDYSPLNSIYMSMGKCFDTCKANYAFAVVQNQACWCSNYVPYSQQDTSHCSQSCPGYPGDLCGNQNENMYGYIPLYKQPSGTLGAPSSTQPPSSLPPPPPPSSSVEPDPKTSYVSKTVTDTVTKKKTRIKTETETETESQRVVTSYVTPDPPSSSVSASLSSVPSSSQAPSSSSSSSFSSSSSSIKVAPKTTVHVTTVSGTIVTQTVTSTPSTVIMNPGNASDSVTMQRKGLSGGAIAGIVLGVLIGLAALFSAAFLLWRRRKYSDTEGAVATTTRRPKRNTSVLSRTGLLGRPQSMSENNYDDPPDTNNGVSSVRHSMMFGAGATVEGVSPSSPLGTSQDNISNPRHSRPMVYDQRLNPSALFANPEANGSRVSMQDQQDYSRPLGITNPDWRSSLDSRRSEV